MRHRPHRDAAPPRLSCWIRRYRRQVHRWQAPVDAEWHEQLPLAQGSRVVPIGPEQIDPRRGADPGRRMWCALPNCPTAAARSGDAVIAPARHRRRLQKHLCSEAVCTRFKPVFLACLFLAGSVGQLGGLIGRWQPPAAPQNRLRVIFGDAAHARCSGLGRWSWRRWTVPLPPPRHRLLVQASGERRCYHARCRTRSPVRSPLGRPTRYTAGSAARDQLRQSCHSRYDESLASPESTTSSRTATWRARVAHSILGDTAHACTSWC